MTSPIVAAAPKGLERVQFWTYFVTLTGISLSLIFTTLWDISQYPIFKHGHFIYGGAGVLLGVCAYIHWRLGYVSNNLMQFAYLMGILLYGYQLNSALTSLGREDFVSGLHMSDTVIWIPLLYLISFTLFHGRQAIRYAVAIFILIETLCIFHAVVTIPTGTHFLVYTVLFDIVIVSVISIALLSFLERAVIELGKAQAYADTQTRLAQSDALTGLSNHRFMQEVLHKEIQKAARYGSSLSVIMLDVDNFKLVNDTHGHLIGDEVLREVAKRIEVLLRASDFAGRWGGEEFIVLVPDTRHEDAIRLAERIKDALADEHFETVGNVTASFGVSSFKEGDSVSSLVDRADKALYQAKHSGKNQVQTLQLAS